MERSSARLRLTGLNGESHAFLGHVIVSSLSTAEIPLRVENSSGESVSVQLCLSEELCKFLSITSVAPSATAAKFLPSAELDGPEDASMAVVLPSRPVKPEPLVAPNQNLVYEDVDTLATFEVPGNSRRIVRLVLSSSAVPSLSSTQTARQRSSRLHRRATAQSFSGDILLLEKGSSEVVGKIRASGRKCESWIRPDVEVLDFGHCGSDVWVFKDFSVRNRSEVAARFCLSVGLRAARETVDSKDLRFVDFLTGFEIDPKMTVINALSVRRIRVGFYAHGAGKWDQWFSLQNLDNANDFWHIQVVARTSADRVAEGILVSCGSELEFGECYANCQTYRDVTIQSNYDENINLALMTDRPRQVSFEILHDWNSEQSMSHNAIQGMSLNEVLPSPNNVEPVPSRVSNAGRDGATVFSTPSLPFETTGELEGKASQSKRPPVYSSPTKDIDDSVEKVAQQGSMKRGRLPESMMLLPRQKKRLRVWYVPQLLEWKHERGSIRPFDEDPGKLRDDNFQLLFEIASGESRSVLGHSRICASVLRLERSEVHLGKCDVLTRYKTYLSIINCADLPALVSINYVSQCVLADEHEIQIRPREAYDLGLDFVPRQVNPGYHKELTITNMRNPMDPSRIFTLKADCVDEQGISLHALFYKILAPTPTNEVDFGVTVANHPAIRAIRVRNVTSQRLVLRFDGSQGVSTFVPSQTPSHATSVAQPILQNGSPKGMQSIPKVEPLWYESGDAPKPHDTDAYRMANALLDMDISRGRSKLSVERGMHTYNSHLGDGRERCMLNSFQSQAPSSTGDDGSQEDMQKDFDDTGEFFALGGERSWLEFLKCLDERDFALLDSMPMFFSNYDAEKRYTEKQFRPARRLRAALEDGYLTETNILTLDPGTESVVVVSLVLTDRDVRGKTKIRPMERHLYVRMLEFDDSRISDVAAADARQMHHLAKLLEVGKASMPREVVLTAQACKSRMTIAPLRQLNFGVIRKGEQKDKAFTIVNLSEAPLLYEIRKVGQSANNDIRFNLGKAIRGVVRPYFTKVVPFIYAPSIEGHFEQKIVVENRLDKSASCGLIVKAFVLERKTAEVVGKVTTP